MRVNPQVFSEAVLDLDLPELYPGDCPLFLTSYIPPQNNRGSVSACALNFSCSLHVGSYSWWLLLLSNKYHSGEYSRGGDVGSGLL